MFELAHMGVRTIGKNHKNLDCFTEYSDIPNLLDLIMEESKFIGKTRKDIANSTKEIFTGPEWLDLNFWINFHLLAKYWAHYAFYQMRLPVHNQLNHTKDISYQQFLFL